MQLKEVLMFALVLPAVLMLAGCGTSRPTSASALSQVFGTDLPGAQGKTLVDQRKIDLTVAGGCSVELYTKQKCREHTQASADRRKELASGDQVGY